MLTPEWWKKNLGGIIFSSFAAILVFALGQYISSSITREMKGYLPLTVWHQWSQEREEWRGKMEAEVKAIEKDLSASRQENLIEIREMSKDVTRTATIVEDLRSTFQKHEALDNERMLRNDAKRDRP